MTPEVKEFLERRYPAAYRALGRDCDHEGDTEAVAEAMRQITERACDDEKRGMTEAEDNAWKALRDSLDEADERRQAAPVTTYAHLRNVSVHSKPLFSGY